MHISLHTAGLDKFDYVLRLHLTCIDCLDHRTEGALSNLLEVNIALRRLHNFLGILVMLLFQMDLLEKLQLLQNCEHVILAQGCEVQISQRTILKVELLLQGIVLLTPVDFDLAVFNGLKLLDYFCNQAGFLVYLLFAAKV